jgi:hypothetical integral membrane protein (TIGR02206 family)
VDFAGETAYTEGMEYFFTLEEDLPAGVGFTLWGGAHFAWLCIAAAIAAALCLAYRRAPEKGRRRLRHALGWAVLVCEALKDVNVALHGGFDVWYLPLHLCGLAVFFTFAHTRRPGKTLGNFLYSCCMPGAAFALLTPDWTAYPPFSYHSIVGFTVHALLVAYPLMLVCGKDLRPEAKYLPRCLGILVCCAVPIYFFNRAFGTNYMFLMWPSPGSPLEWFASFLGRPGYLLGYLPMLALVWLILYLPFARRKA